MNSIAVRLALWYALSAFALVVATSGSLYWALLVNLDREDALTLENHVLDLRLLLSTTPAGAPFEDTAVKRLSFQTKQEIFVRLVDGTGATLFESPGMSALAPAALFPKLSDLESQKPIERDIVTERVRRLHMVTTWAAIDPTPSDQRQLQLAVDRDDEERFLRHFRDFIFGMLAIAVAACAFGGVLIARRGLRPIVRISRAASETRSATLNKRLPLDGLPSELAQLGVTFNAMLDRLEDAFARMSQFSADVAHELRTPIANLRGEIEVTLGKTRTSAEYQDILGSNLEECERLTRIIHSLLFLSKAEAARQPEHHEQVDLHVTIASVIDFYETAAAEASVALRLEGKSVLWASVDRTLVQQAVSNLISNAITYTPPRGTVTVTLTTVASDVQITVVDTGSGIASNHLPRVFDRFYRADRARTGSTQHVGLGLTLVQSIAVLHGGTAEIKSVLGQGTCVTLQFPLVNNDLLKTT